MPEPGPYGRWTRVRPGAEEEYRRWHRPDQVPEDLLHLVRASGFRDYSIFMRGRDLFATFRTSDLDASAQRMAADPVFNEWMRTIAPLMDADDAMDPWQPIELVFRLP